MFAVLGVGTLLALSMLHSRGHAAEGVRGDSCTVGAAQKFSFGGIRLVVAKFALGAAFDAAPELARVFEVHLPAGIAKHRGRGLLSVEESTAILAGLGVERNRAQRYGVVRHHEPVKQELEAFDFSECRTRVMPPLQNERKCCASRVAGAEASATMRDASRKNC